MRHSGASAPSDLASLGHVGRQLDDSGLSAVTRTQRGSSQTTCRTNPRQDTASRRGRTQNQYEIRGTKYDAGLLPGVFVAEREGFEPSREL